MKSMFSFAKLFGASLFAGAVGAGVVFLAIDSDELVGAAAGKKATKKKSKANKTAIWEDVARDLAVPTPAQNPIPNVPSQGAMPNSNLASDNSIDGPISDPRNPALCQARIQTNRVQLASSFGNLDFDRVLIRGEIRGFERDSGTVDTLCVIDIYPEGCEESYRFAVPAASVNNSQQELNMQHICTELSQGYFHSKEVIIQAYVLPNSFPKTVGLVHRIYFTPRTLAQVAEMVEVAEDRANQAHSAPDVSGIIDRMFGR